jgi:3-hydroxyacyl-[acyl-carrier-protein] dehydratase
MSLYTDLKNSEISVLKKKRHQIHAVFLFKKELDFFKGHFPGNPILPGIFQIEMVKYALEKSFDNNFYIKSVKKTKFSSLIQPEKTVTIDITINKEENSLLDVRAILRVSDKVAGKINLILTKKYFFLKDYYFSFNNSSMIL